MPASSWIRQYLTDESPRHRASTRRGPRGVRRRDSRARGGAGRVAALGARNRAGRRDRGLRRRPHLRRRDARRPGGSPSLAALREGLPRRDDRRPHAPARRLPRLAAAGRGGGRVRPAGERAGDRVATRRGDRGGEGGPAARAHGAELRGLPVAQLRGPAARVRDAPRPQPGVRPGLSRRRGGLGHPVPRGGERGGRGGVDRRLPLRRGRRPDRRRPGGAAGRDPGEDRRLEPPRARALRPVPGSCRASASSSASCRS